VSTLWRLTNISYPGPPPLLLQFNISKSHKHFYGNKRQKA
jgi:hypothetical protein